MHIPDTSTDADELVDALVQSSFAVMSVLTRVASEHDLSLTQLRVLGILRDRRLRMAELAAFLGLEKSTISGLVDRADKRGLTTRMPSAQDGRAVDVALTRAGVELAQSVTEQVARSLDPLITGLAPADRRRLHDLLTRLLGSAQI